MVAVGVLGSTVAKPAPLTVIVALVTVAPVGPVAPELAVEPVVPVVPLAPVLVAFAAAIPPETSAANAAAAEISVVLERSMVPPPESWKAFLLDLRRPAENITALREKKDVRSSSALFGPTAVSSTDPAGPGARITLAGDR